MFKKTAVLITVVLALTVVSSFALPPEGSGVSGPNLAADNDTYIVPGNMLMLFTNHGNFGSDVSNIFGYYSGTFYPFNTIADIESGTLANTVIYSAGIWLGGVVGEDTLVTVSEYDDEYVPGPMVIGGSLPDNPLFKVYKLYSDSLAGNPNDDYQSWPVDQGAPVNLLGDPVMLGDQMLWTVFNDADPVVHTEYPGHTSPLGVEVQSTSWVVDGANGLDRTVFIKYKLYNKGTNETGDNTIHDFYIGFWFDPDLGGSSDDLIGCDTNRNMFYCYNATNSDAQYGSTPPVLGVKVLYGPLVPSTGDTAFFDGHPVPGYKNLDLTAFTGYINGTDPNVYSEAYNYMHGLNADGTPLANGSTYMFPGNPIAGTGDLDSNPSDKRMMGCLGPISEFGQLDSQFVMIAISIGQGTDRLSSLGDLKANLDLMEQDGIGTGLPLGSIAYLDEDTLYAYTANAVYPVIKTVYAGNFDGVSAFDIVQSGDVSINGDIIPTNMEVAAPSFEGFNGYAVKADIDVRGLIQDYAPIWDVTEYEFTFDFDVPGFTPPPPGVTGTVLIKGHISGDANLDGNLNLLDIIYLIQYKFHDGPPPRMFASADVNVDGNINLLDILYLIDSIYKNGPAPQHP